MPADTFPNSVCPICLDVLENAVYLNPCLHMFCFHCIREWSRLKAECPLCQQPFSLCCTVHAEDDISTPSENESFSSSDHSTITFVESPFDLEAWDQHANYDYPMSSHSEGSSSDSTILAVFSDEANSQELEHGSSEHGVDPFSWTDEIPGPSCSPSEEYGSTIISSSDLESSCEDSAWERLTLQSQLQSSVDSSDSYSSSEYHDIASYINLYAERTPELTELSSDSEESIREKREDVKKEQSTQDSSWSDREPRRASTPFSPLYKEHVSSCQSTLLSAVKRTMSMHEQNNKDKIKDHSPHDSDWSLSPGMDDVCSPHSQRLFRKRKTRSPQNSEGSHGHWPWKKHHSEHQFKKRLSKSRDGSKHQSKRSRRSRPCDMSPSRKSQTESSSCENTSSRDSSRSWSCHKGHGQRRSSSLDSDCCCRRACYQSSYLLHSPKTAGDSFSCSKSTQSETHSSSKSPGPEIRIQSFTERTDLHSQMGLHEKQDSCYEQCTPRSRSSSRSRSPSGETNRTRSEKPGGKRKCKTRHLENAERGSTSRERKYSLERIVSTFSDCCKDKGGLSDTQESSETNHEKKKKSMGSPSMEGVCGGTDTVKCALKKKCKKKHQEHHWKDA